MTGSKSASDRKLLPRRVLTTWLVATLIAVLLSLVLGDRLRRGVFDGWQSIAPRDVSATDVRVVGKGNAVFITIEDETGITNALLWERLMRTQRRAVMASRLMVIEGVIQRSREGVVHLMATRVHDRSAELDRLTNDNPLEFQLAYSDEIAHPQMPRGHGHPRNVRILPRSRDFH